jgi:hypothetical protein
LAPAHSLMGSRWGMAGFVSFDALSASIR